MGAQRRATELDEATYHGHINAYAPNHPDRVHLGAMAFVYAMRSRPPLEPTPNVAVHTADGVTVRLADYKGKVVLIDFWASWCPPCKTSFPALDAIYREYREKGLEVLAVNVDERRHDADTFLDAHPHRLTVLYDPKGVVAGGVRRQGHAELIPD